jgi:hypothetical protein
MRCNKRCWTRIANASNFAVQDRRRWQRGCAASWLAISPMRNGRCNAASAMWTVSARWKQNWPNHRRG